LGMPARRALRVTGAAFTLGPRKGLLTKILRLFGSRKYRRPYPRADNVEELERKARSAPQGAAAPTTKIRNGRAAISARLSRVSGSTSTGQRRRASALPHAMRGCRSTQGESRGPPVCFDKGRAVGAVCEFRPMPERGVDLSCGSAGFPDGSIVKPAAL
jgi:hypothetical protein